MVKKIYEVTGHKTIIVKKRVKSKFRRRSI